MNSMGMQSSRAPCGAWRTILALAFAGVALHAAAAAAEPKIWVDDAVVSEGQSGTANLVFTVFLDDGNVSHFPPMALDEPITVTYQTSDVTASAAGGDYVPVTGTLRFDRLGTSKQVIVPIHGDHLYEFSETLALDLIASRSGSTGIDVPRVIGTILNDDEAPGLSVDDAIAAEGDAGITGIAFTVALSAVSGLDTELDFATVDGTARVIDGDYQAVDRHVVIPAGTPSVRVVVGAVGETKYESGETFGVLLANPVNAFVSRDHATGTIVNDDANLGPNLVRNPTFANDLDGWVSLGTCKVGCKPQGVGGPHSAEILGDGDAAYGVDDSPNTVQLTPAENTRYRVSAYVWGDESDGAAQIRVHEYHLGNLVRTSLSPAVELRGDEWTPIAFDVITKHAGSELDLQILDHPNCKFEGFHVDDVALRQYLPGDVPPEINLLESAVIRPGAPFTLDLVATDADGQDITALADLSDFPADNLPVFTTPAAASNGRFVWTPRPADLRVEPYVAHFMAVNTSGAARDVALRVAETPENLIRNAGFEANLGGWHAFGDASLLRVPSVWGGQWAVEITGPAVKQEFGLMDLPAWVTVVASQGTEYEFSAWVRSEAGHGAVHLQVTEMNGSSIMGTAASTDVLLTPNWALVAVRYTPLLAGTSLTLQVVDVPAAAPETFQVDQVVAQIVGQDPSAAGEHGSRRVGKPPVMPESGNLIRASVQPNPARGAVTLSVTLSRPGPLRIELFDASGRLVRVLAAGESFGEGINHFTFGRVRGERPLPNGMYLYRVHSNAGERVGRFVVLD